MLARIRDYLVNFNSTQSERQKEKYSVVISRVKFPFIVLIDKSFEVNDRAESCKTMEKTDNKVKLKSLLHSGQISKLNVTHHFETTNFMPCL